MKPKAETVWALLIVLIALILGASVPPPPESGDLLFKIGWYLGGVVGHIEKLFR